IDREIDRKLALFPCDLNRRVVLTIGNRPAILMEIRGGGCLENQDGIVLWWSEELPGAISGSLRLHGGLLRRCQDEPVVVGHVCICEYQGLLNGARVNNVLKINSGKDASIGNP